jgi:hypothetical protein
MVATTLSAKLGHCPRCMRQSFIFMVGAWTLASGITLAANTPLFLITGWVIAGGSILLWLMHLSSFALRSVRTYGASTTNLLQNNEAADPPEQLRRHLVLSFARSFLLVAATTALPLRAAWAQSCDCPPTAPKCCFNYRGDIYACAPSDAICCAKAEDPYYCPSGSSCYGEHDCH